MSRVVYLIEQPLDARNYERFGIGAWIDRGWEVEVWDLTPLSHPQVWRAHISGGAGQARFPGHFPLGARRELKERAAEGSTIAYFIDLASDTYYAGEARAQLARRGAQRVVCSTGAIPTPAESGRSPLSVRFHKARAVGAARSLRMLMRPLWRSLTQPVVPATLTIVAGESSLPQVGAETELIRAHNLDYDVYLKLAGEHADAAGNGGTATAAHGDEYIVFIDQDYCFHVEYLYQGVPALPPGRYFPALCRGLRYIGGALSSAVRVAAHPRAGDRRRIEEHFEGLPIEFGNTAELVRGCKAVVCHDSTAIQFAVLFGKPVIFVTTDELDRLFLDSSFKRESIACFATELGKPVINLDRDLAGVDWHAQLQVDARKYADYRHRYIKLDGSPEIPYWSIVIDHIERKPC